MTCSLFFTGRKDNVTVVQDTADYNRKATALLEDHAYRKLKKDATSLWSARQCFS
jgi:hypothetical protein